MRVEIPRNLLLVLIAVTYGGAVPFLPVVSPWLIYIFYAAIGACLALCLALQPPAIENLRSIRPYLAWVVFFFLWGTLFSLDISLVLPDVVRAIARNLLVLVMVVIALANRRDLTKFALLVQGVAIINVGISILELFNPQITSTIAYTVDPGNIAFSVYRPSGLWINPNEAAFALLFALMISYWAHGPLAWAGRIASIAGILLTASRSGLYILLLCGALYLLYKLKQRRAGAVLVPVLIGVSALVALLGIWLVSNPDVLGTDALANLQISRVLDLSENASQQAGIDTRGGIALDAARAAFEGPWFGYGVFTFEGFDYPSLRSPIILGAHDIYLAVWGEAGILGIVSYFLVLAIGISHLFESGMSADERIIVGLLWISYLLIGFVWHNQLASVLAMVYVGLLYHLPALLGTRADATVAVVRFETQGS